MTRPDYTTEELAELRGAALLDELRRCEISAYSDPRANAALFGASVAELDALLDELRAQIAAERSRYWQRARRYLAELHELAESLAAYPRDGTRCVVCGKVDASAWYQCPGPLEGWRTWACHECYDRSPELEELP